MRLLEALRNSVARLEADLADSFLFTHMGDRGEFRERVIERFLRPYLPKCYGIGSGAVFSADGSGSRQIDIVLHDAVFSTVLFSDSPNSLFPVESVFGVIEVKSDLSTAELEQSIEIISSVKKLPREASTGLDILPFRGFRVDQSTGLQFSTEPRNPYLGICFGFDGLRGETVTEHLNEHLRKKPEDKDWLPDCIFNYRRQYVVVRGARESNGDCSPRMLHAPYDGFACLSLGRDTLPLFFLTVNFALNNIVLKAPNLQNYWDQVFNEAIRASTTA